MKTRILLTLALMTSLGVAPGRADSARPNRYATLRGTPIFHWFIHEPMEAVIQDGNTNPVPWGRVIARHLQQGNAEIDGLALGVVGLTPNTNYWLLAKIGDDTNYVDIVELWTNRRGVLHFRGRNLGQSNGGGYGHEKFKLPDLLKPLNHVHELAVANGDRQVLIRAGLSEPNFFQYLVRRQLTNDGVDSDATGVIHMRGHHRVAWFRLFLGGLEPNAEYSLVLNGVETQTLMANEFGHVNIQINLDTPWDILSIKTLAIWDANDQSILSTSFDLP